MHPFTFNSRVIDAWEYVPRWDSQERELENTHKYPKEGQ